MDPKIMLEILHIADRLKHNTRHNWLEDDRKESVADHSWRIALMAMLLDGIEEFKSIDLNRVIRMCLIHDLGEAFTGDIPTFDKTDADHQNEEDILFDWVKTFPSPQREEWLELLQEMQDLKSPEANVYKSLDKLEAVLAHDEAGTSHWLPLEYDLQRTYAVKQTSCSEYLTSLRQEIDRLTEQVIKESEINRKD